MVGLPADKKRRSLQWLEGKFLHNSESRYNSYTFGDDV
jgi:hypothetical protein